MRDLASTIALQRKRRKKREEEDDLRIQAMGPILHFFFHVMCLPLPATLSNDTPPRRIRRQPFAFRRKKGVIFYRDDKGNLLLMPPTMSSWYKLYCEEDSQETISNFHEKFRRRFRLPHKNFTDLVEKVTAESNRGDGLFSRWRPGKQAVSGQLAAPLNLFVLTSLRYLGRGWTFDDLEEATAISEEVIMTFYHEFIEFGATKLYPTCLWELGLYSPETTSAQ
ncbi:hypothetical protein IV203_017226 [Nitzschia inconspicua]|uniref:Uncharacterized protein n=1 Tax=Nitzschia inconspicua TaxID=303405 RepID=A0A9K3PJ11_9STRA|nr:hypothetical protein IV203_017226 [Nitzschia inconspicua]